NNGIDSCQIRRRQRRSVRVVVDVERAHPVAALPRNLRHQAAGLSFAEYEDEHNIPSKRNQRSAVFHCERFQLTTDHCFLASTSKIVGSGSWKNAACSERTASSASSSSIMKLILISLAPCEIMRTLMCRTALKTCAAMPF